MPYITLHGMLHYYFFLLFITLHIHKNPFFSYFLFSFLLPRWKQWGWKIFVQALEKKFPWKSKNKTERNSVSFTQRIQEKTRKKVSVFSSHIFLALLQMLHRTIAWFEYFMIEGTEKEKKMYEKKCL